MRNFRIRLLHLRALEKWIAATIAGMTIMKAPAVL
jgi:hypothetical protein